jgi:hypothetical protein
MTENDQRQNWNRQIIDEFRANNGVVGGPFAGVPLVLLHTRQSRSHFTVELDAGSFAAHATVLDGDDRDRVYAETAMLQPAFAEYAATVPRVIPVIALDEA